MDNISANIDLWKKVLIRLEPTIKKSYFLTWFQNTTILSQDENSITVGVPTPFALNWISQKYDLKILQASQEIINSIKKIEYKVQSSLSSPDSTEAVKVQNLFKDTIKKTRKLPNKAHVSVMPGVTSKIINPKYTLQNFITGQTNHLAHAVCQAVGQNPGSLYNPLFIYGGVGLGKTHLLQATGNLILQNNPDKVVVYMTSEKFMNEIIDAIGKKRTKSFKDRYRNVDCFIIDDIQFLANKSSTQEEFFHTFNSLYDNNKQIIISSDRSPNQLNGLIEDRLVSRFAMGMIVDVSLPDTQTRLSILTRKCQEQQVFLAPELLQFIAENCKSSIRELEGVLIQTITRAKVLNTTPTINMVREMLEKLNYIEPAQNQNSQEKPKTISNIINTVADYFHISEKDITSTTRRKEIMLPRQICMYLIRKELEKPYELIGEQFGGRSHTTVMHAFEKIQSKIHQDQKLTADLHSIKQSMGL